MENEALDSRPLAGLRVFELGTAIAGPTCGLYLAHFGAEVIKVETRINPDTMRVFGSGWFPVEKYGREVWADSNPGMNEFNAGKKSIGLNLKTAKGSAIAKQILSKCDIFLSNLTPRAMKSLELDYEGVCRAKPDIVYILMSGYGSTPGPYANYVAFGKNLVALTGIDELTGWADRPPVGITRVAYPDHSNALHAVMAVLAAIDYRDRTGEGQAIDMSQFEATVALLGAELMAFAAEGQRPNRMGNRQPTAAPQGVYACRGDDRWVAISVATEDEWRSLCRVAGHMEWIEDLRFRTFMDRQANHDEIDTQIESWTMGYANVEVAEWLQKAGVTASPVLDCPGLAVDSHLAARQFWSLGEHRRFGDDVFSGNPIRLSETPGSARVAGPAFGQDNQSILGDLCGLSAAEIEDLTAEGVVEPMAQPELRLERPYVRWLRHFMPQLPWRE